VASVALDISDAEITRLNDGGVVGIRFSLQYSTTPSLASPAAQGLLARVREMGWFVQIVGQGEQVAAALPVMRKAQVRALIDHCGRPDPRKGVAHESFQRLLTFGRETDSMIKLSAPWRFSREDWPYGDATPYVTALVEAFTLDRCVWGSDWPFSRTGMRIDYGPVLDCLERFLPDETDRRRVLWDNPARLFGFG
jgi:predicted TIM-barrel fold metal-dependent hydrolase